MVRARRGEEGGREGWEGAREVHCGSVERAKSAVAVVRAHMEARVRTQDLSGC